MHKFNTSSVIYCPTPLDLDPAVHRKVEDVLSGKLSIDDALEMSVDEISVAGNVGSGVERPLGNQEDESMQKLKRAYEDYLARRRKKSSSGLVNEFMEDVAPGASSELTKRFESYIKDKGFQL